VSGFVVSGYLLEMMTMSKQSRQLRKRVKRENRIRLAKASRRNRQIMKKKLEKTEEKAKVLPTIVDNINIGSETSSEPQQNS
tara:strand:- start:2713 stop:2958 length:246 start_codon:yes stop_codon:yes gene_type:complete